MPTYGDEFEPGDCLGDFQIIRRIGRGGMGSVYLAEDTRLRRQIALKVILPEFADQPDFRRRFEAEARGAAAIEHPNLVPVHSAGVLDSRLFLAMRYIEGQNLNEALDAHGPLGSEDAARIVAQIASALDAAHAGGLVHRDVTPANILLEGELGAQGVYLTDFGLVRGLDSGETRLTRTEQVIANLDYAAPEQIQGTRVDARTDVYALGCVLYRMRSGKRPFPGTDTQKMWKIVNDSVPPVGGDDPIDEVIARATAKSPDRRYPSAGDLARAAAEPAAAVTRRLPEQSVATGPAAAGYYEAGGLPADAPTGRQGGGFSPEPATEVLGRSSGPDGRRRRLLALGAGAIALLIGAGIAIALVANGGREGHRTVVRETVTQTTEAPARQSGNSGKAEAPREEPQGSSPEETTQHAVLPGLEPFTGLAYPGIAPRGWEQELVDEPVTDYYENLWRDPSDPENTFIRIDGGNPESIESPFAASEGLVEEVRQSPGYQEISYGPDFKGGREAARWIYEIDGDKRADYFFVECGQGLASVGSTSPERYPELAAMFREVAFSTYVYC